MKSTHFIISRSILTALGMLACWFLPICVWASVQVDGIYYELNTSARTAAVASNPNYYSGTVSIPSSFVYDGVTYRVTSIGSTAFLDCNGMTAIYMPSSVTSIASSAFERCKGLTNLKIGSGVTTINYEAFKNCSNLTSLILPASVKTISDEVFSGCTSLMEIIAERTTAPTISSSTFNGVDKSSCTVYVPEGYRSSYANAANWKTFSNIVERTVLATGSCGNNVIYTIYFDMTMEISGEGAMYDRDWDDPIIADYCDQIKQVIIGEGVTSIGGYAFWSYTSLSSITIPSSVTSIGYDAFSSCTSLSTITIPSSVTSIGVHAFSSCTSLSSITIPSSVTRIGSYAFVSCTSLFSVSIPYSVNFIGYGVFSGCTNLSGISVSDSNAKYDSRENCNAIIESSTNTLIAGCQNTVIPSSVTSIGYSAFSGCTSLSSIIIPSSVTSIGSSAFYSCTSLSSIEIPSSVTSIGDWAFESCTSLTSVSMPYSVNSIGYDVFCGCTNLSGISVSGSNTNYDSRDNCNAIIETSTNTLVAGCKNTMIPSSVTSIGDGAFYNCTSQTSITVPGSVTRIGSSAFYSCISLNSVWMEAAAPISISDSVFSLVDKYACTLYVPIGSKTAYENATNWNDFQKIVEYVVDPGTNISELDNAIYVDPVQGCIGGTMDIPVKMKNSYPVRGFQFKLEMPDGTTINEWKLSINRLPLGATLSDMIATQRIDGNTIYVVCTLNYGDATFTGNDGEIATVNVTFSDYMEAGTYPIYLTGCDVADAAAHDEDLSDIKATLVLEDFLQGDANGDGKVRIGDATAILNYIVGNVPSNFKEKAADTNGDGKIRIGDATAILNIIVNQ